MAIEKTIGCVNLLIENRLNVKYFISSNMEMKVLVVEDGGVNKTEGRLMDHTSAQEVESIRIGEGE